MVTPDVLLIAAAGVGAAYAVIKEQWYAYTADDDDSDDGDDDGSVYADDS